MRPAQIAVALLAITASMPRLQGQALPDTLTPAQLALACAPQPAAEPAPAAARVLGAQGTVPHTIHSPQDLLVVRGGTNAGLQLGQQFFIRRGPGTSGGYMGRAPREAGSTTTAGWLRIVALNDTTSIARIEYACGAIFTNDYLEPFAAPSLPPDADRDDSTGDLDFTSLSRVVAASDNHLSAAPGEYVIIDRGADQGIQPGGRLAIFRDLRIPGMPMTAVGEAVVMSTAQDRAVIRINRARDAVLVGDYLVPRKNNAQGARPRL